jgi:tripartite-type tricarboxylate transporter receptor subunit TctC
MKLPRRNFLHLAAGAATLPSMSRFAWAQGYPNRYVRLVVPFPPGGTGDPVGRVIASRLSEIWGQQVVVENKGGAAGNIAAQTVAQAEPDGYDGIGRLTLLQSLRCVRLALWDEGQKRLVSFREVRRHYTSV